MMETIVGSRNESLKQELVEAAAHHGTNQDQKTQQAPSKEMEYLRRALLDSQKQNFVLASDITALKQQMAAKESGSDDEKMRILKVQRSERVLRKEAQKDLKVKDQQNPDLQCQLLQTPSNQLKDSQHITELASENAALKQQMAAKETEWEDEKMRILKALRSERLIRKEAQKDLKGKEQEKYEDLSAKLRTLQEDFERKANQVVESEQKLTALNYQLQNEVTVKVANFMRVQELEEDIKLLTQNNPDLHVQPLQTPSNQLKDSQHITELASENAALKQQMAAKESEWEDEKMRILRALRSERLIRKEAQKDLKGKDQEKYEDLSAKLRTLQEDFERKANQVVESEQKLTALNYQLQNEVTVKVANFMRVQELEEDIKLLTQNNPDLHIQPLQTPSNQLKDSQHIAALKQHMAAKESEWEDEKMRILKALRSERLIRKEAQKDLKGKDQQNPDLQVQLLQTPSNQLKDSQHITELASENAALKQQMAAKETEWEDEKMRILKALRSERLMREQAQTDLKNKEQEKQEVTDSLSQSLLQKENEFRLFEQHWIAELEKVSASWKGLTQKTTEAWQKALQSAYTQKDLMVKSLQEESNRKVSQVVLEKDNLIAQITTAKTALEVQNLEREAQLKEKEVQLIQSEAEWKTKLSAQQDQLASKEENIKELQTNSREMEQQLKNQLSHMEEQNRLQTADLQEQLLSLQEIHHKPDLDQMKANKKELKRRIKEREVEEKRQKKEKEEREKREREELKREKREREEREKKEKKENEKREKEELKRLKKDEEAREKKEREDLKREKERK